MKNLVLSLFAFLSASALLAQTPIVPLPMDPNVRYGRLDNGLTYYIEHNELPEHHAEFYIAQRVGSILEEESQRGLAHFLEHMAFNGSKHFPGKGMLDYLQRNGVKFGTNVNAYTSIDETVYNISDVPTDETHPGIVDSCLLILHDWSGCLLLEDKEIDDERGVIHEEWRTRNSAGLRMYEQTILPKLLPDNRYSCRMPIGLMSVVDSFTYDELRNYYHKWYRPDLQAVMVVGDVDVDAVEEKIRTLWQDIQTPADAAERYYIKVEGNQEPLVAIASDPEMTGNQITVYYKRPAMRREFSLSRIGYTHMMVENIVASCINMRCQEIALKADAPFQSAGVSFSQYLTAKTMDAFTISVSVKPGKWDEGLRAAVAVVKGAVEHGLTQSEVDRVKAEIMSGYENSYKERDKRKNRPIVEEMKRHFLSDEPMPGIEYEWQMLPEILKYLTPDILNGFCRTLLTDENMAISMMATQKEDNPLPDEAQLLASYREAMAQTVEAYQEEVVATRLIPELPQPGTIRKVRKGPFGSTEWVLSNGVRLFWKATDFKKDQVTMSAYSDGGTRLYADLPRGLRSIIGTAYDLGGVGDFSPIALGKALAGKQANVSASVSTSSESLSGSATPKDLRTMFELTYLTFTAPRQDREVYESFRARFEQGMKNREGTPQKIISDSSAMTFYRGQTLLYPLQLADLQDMDYDKAFQLGKERFANAADFTFFLIGNIDEDSLRVFATQYLATLPASRKGLEKRQKPIVYTPGTRQNRFDVPMEQPKTSVDNVFMLHNRKWSLKDDITATMLGQILNIVFTNTIREQEGGVYSPRASAGFSYASRELTLYYSFETGADKREHIEEVAYRETEKLAQPGGVPADAFQKTHDYLAKVYQERQKENGYWMGQIQMQVLYGMDKNIGYLKALDSITPDDVQHLLADLLKGDRIQFVSNGVERVEN